MFKSWKKLSEKRDEISKEWVPKTDMVIIEIHEKLRKGCEERVYKVMNEYGFKSVKYDENVIFFRDKVNLVL